VYKEYVYVYIIEEFRRKDKKVTLPAVIKKGDTVRYNIRTVSLIFPPGLGF
jgi:hypothetical protein